MNGYFTIGIDAIIISGTLLALSSYTVKPNKTKYWKAGIVIGICIVSIIVFKNIYLYFPFFNSTLLRHGIIVPSGLFFIFMASYFYVRILSNMTSAAVKGLQKVVLLLALAVAIAGGLLIFGVM